MGHTSITLTGGFHPPNGVMCVGTSIMLSPCVIGHGPVRGVRRSITGIGTHRTISIRRGRPPVNEVAVRPVYGLPPSEFRIPGACAWEYVKISMMRLIEESGLRTDTLPHETLAVSSCREAVGAFDHMELCDTICGCRWSLLL